MSEIDFLPIHISFFKTGQVFVIQSHDIPSKDSWPCKIGWYYWNGVVANGKE
jgi:hypothetical protein